MRPATVVVVVALFLALHPATFASTTWYVNGVSGSDSNNCKSGTTACKTITHAVSLASSGDSIAVAAATYKENLTITFNLTVRGAAAGTTIIDGGALNTVVTISSSKANVTLANLTIRNGKAKDGGGINNSGTLTVNNCVISGNSAFQASSSNRGGGIANGGTLTINSSTLTGNTAVGMHCVIYCIGSFGGAISNGGTLTVNDSTLSNNSAPSFRGGGGGIENGGTVSINNSTLSGNSAPSGSGGGGGIYSANGGLLTINNSTLSGNNAYLGGAIDVYNAPAVLQNTIVANNGGGNCFASLTSHGYNLSSDGSCNFNGPGDMNDINPLLGPLQNNGGPTQTMALLPGSPAIDAGNPAGCTDGQGHLLRTDQRGMPRPDKEDTSGCDVGAYERQED